MRASEPASPDSLEASYRRHVDKILASTSFRRADRLGQFLRFVVEKQLAGETGDLKETAIGTQVYGRPAGYDPKIDPIVRTEARRMRRKLQEYADEHGAEDDFILRLPTGGYAPVFDTSGQRVKEEEAADEPLALIEPIQPPRRWRPWAIALAGVVLAGAAITFWRRPSSSQAVPPTGVVTPLTSYPGVEFFPSFAPDGERLAFVWNGTADNFDIYIKKLSEETPRRLTTSPAHDIQPAWSPNGRDVAFLRCWPDGRVELIVIPVEGGAERVVQVLHPGQGNWEPDASIMRRRPGVAWLPDGKHLVSSDRCGPAAGSADCLYSFSVEGLERQRLTTPRESSVGDSLPAVSPDGARLCFVRTSSERQISELFVRRMRDGAIQQITWDGKTVSEAAWLSNEAMVFVSNRAGGNRLWTAKAEGGKPEVISEAGRSVGSLAASRDGNRLVYSESFRNSNIWQREISGNARSSDAVRVLSSSGGNDSALYSPDGRRIVFMSDRSGTPQIWVAEEDGSHPAMLTNFSKATPVGSPRWSPDGKTLVFDSARGGHSVILTMAAREGSVPAVFADEAGDNMMPTWSRDGRFIYYVRRQSGPQAIYKKALSGGSPVEIAAEADSEAFETADGQKLIYVSGGAIEQVSPEGGQPQVLVADVSPSRYFAIGTRGVFFVPSARETAPRVEYYDFSTRQRRILFRLSRPLQYGTPSLAVSPDERKVLYSQLDNSGSDLMLLQLH